MMNDLIGRLEAAEQEFDWLASGGASANREAIKRHAATIREAIAAMREHEMGRADEPSPDEEIQF